MYERVSELFTSGDIYRLLAFCRIPRDDWDDLAQEVALILLEKKEGEIGKLHEYTISVIKYQYFGKRSKWHFKERRWKEARTDLSDADGEVSDLGGQGDIR